MTEQELQDLARKIALALVKTGLIDEFTEVAGAEEVILAVLKNES